MHAVLDVTVDGHKRAHKAIVKDMQLDPVKPTVTHIDLQEIRLDEPIETTVAVRFEGEAAGVKVGGMLESPCARSPSRAWSPTSPSTSCIDISDLGMGDAAKVGDLQVPEGVEILADPEEVLCSVLAPRKATRARGRGGRRGVAAGRARDRRQGAKEEEA